MRTLTALLLALTLLLGLAACSAPVEVPTPSAPPQVSAPPKEKQTFALAYDPDDSLHPLKVESQINLELASLVYEGLFRLDLQFEAQPVLAQSASPDESGLVWTVVLKEGVQFSDGTPLTAAHVAESLNAARKSALYSGRLAQIRSVKERDGTVVLTLTEANGALPALLDVPVVLEQEEGPPLGTGRYRYVVGEEQVDLMVNSSRPGWDGLPYGVIPLRPVTAAEEKISAFDSGSISLVSVDFSAAYTLGYSCSYEMWDYPTTNLIYVGFRTTDGPCQSAEVRKACSKLFDREAVTALLPGSRGEAACLPMSPRHQEYDGGAAGALDWDGEGALALLKQAGYKKKEADGLFYQGRTPLTLKLIVNRDSDIKSAIAAELAKRLGEEGVTVQVERLSWADYLKALEEEAFDLYLGEVRLSGDFDPTQLLAGDLNYGGWESEELFSLLTEWRGEEGTGRREAAARLWELLAAQAPIAPLCFKQETLLVRWGMVSNLNPTRGDLFYGMEEWITLES